MNHPPVSRTQNRHFENVLSAGNAAVQESSSNIAAFMALLLEATVFRHPRQKEDLVGLVSSLITFSMTGRVLQLAGRTATASQFPA
ncbi:hypothetical protein R1T40_21355 (plasmid) [Tritonibacter scottomollicae]|uniref:Uncharacterized protein n=1 Tax=Tritonibacter scottomollicae TaxID=483013 RepID=A0ABZ0HPU8_TRISK|nr:hypothetical protein R1T40_21355 [Tritonibacter scottomollicae]